MNGSNVAKIEEKPVVEAQTQDPMLDMIDKVCSDPSFDIEKMQKMIDMRNEELSRVAKIDFNRAFAEMQPKLPRIISAHKNDQTNSSYSKIEDINDGVLPVLSEHGFGVSFKIVKQDKDSVTIRATLKHRGGHEDSTELLMPYDNVGIKGTVNKTNIHATGSTITYAKRYAMCMLLDISTGTDNDAARTNTKKIATETAAKIKEILEENESIDGQAFLKYMKADCVDNILSKDFEKANIALNRKLQKEKVLFKTDDTKEN